MVNRLFCDTEVAIPADAPRPCSQCFLPMRLLDDLNIDEGDGAAMIGLRCGQCCIESYHSWIISDEVFEAVFGYAFGDRPDDEDDD